MMIKLENKVKGKLQRDWEVTREGNFFGRKAYGILVKYNKIKQKKNVMEPSTRDYERYVFIQLGSTFSFIFSLFWSQ